MKHKNIKYLKKYKKMILFNKGEIMKRKLKWKNIIIIFILILSIILFITSIINFINWKLDSKKIDNQIKELEKITNIEEIKDNENTEIIEQDNIKKDNPYWHYIKINLINVNFKELKEKNKDTKGWLQVNGTNINYPFVQSNDNKYYLTHSFDKKYNDAGWVFLDYRNDIKSLEKNTIIYAHSRLDKTMFGSLKNILKGDWLRNTNNHVIKLSTEKENTLWQVFSVYHIPTNNDYIQVDFDSNEEFINWANKLMKRSIYNFNTSINENDKVLTLSTCYKTNEKMVLHAKLIKKETR